MNVCELKIHGDINADLIDPILTKIENSDCDAFLLRINTEGGLVDKAFQLISELKNSGKPFFAINEGFAISCGAVILASADKSYGYPYSITLIHDPFYEDADADEFLMKVKDSLMSILSNKIKTDNLSQLLSDETTWNAKEAKQYGLIDEIIGEMVLPVSNYRRDVINSLFDNKKFYSIMNKELEEKIAEEVEKTVEAPVVVETEEAEKTVETPETEEAVEVEVKEDTVNECGEPKEEVKDEETKEEVKEEEVKDEETKEEVKEEEVKNDGEEERIAELERLITEKDAYIAELEAKLEEATGKKEEVIDKGAIDKLSKDAINSIKHLFDSEAVLNDDIRLAEKIFDINGDETLRLRIREKQPELYNRLLEKYYSK